MKHGAKRGVCAPKKLKLARLETCAHIRSDQREREGEEGRSERSLLKLLHRHRSCHDQKTPQGSAVSVRPSVQGVRGREEEEEEEEQEGHVVVVVVDERKEEGRIPRRNLTHG